MPQEELEKILRDIQDSDNFIFGINRLLTTDEQRQELADALNQRGWKDPSRILAYAYSIYSGESFESIMELAKSSIYYKDE